VNLSSNFSTNLEGKTSIASNFPQKKRESKQLYKTDEKINDLSSTKAENLDLFKQKRRR
jgi:hypothetical protein